MKNKQLLFDNQTIICRLKSGSESYFDHVYKHYFNSLCAFASRYVSYSEAEEIVQETMIWLWENKETLIPEMSLKSLLFTIVRNKALNQISHQQVKSRVLQEIGNTLDDQLFDPDFYTDTEIEKLYQETVNRMIPDFRKTFELNRMEGLTHKEIANQLNVSVQTVNYRICHALTLLRKVFKDYLKA